MAETRRITLTVRSVDGFRLRRVYKTLAGARAFAHNRVGPHPESSADGTSLTYGYAVEPWSGTTVLDFDGATYEELWPRETPPVVDALDNPWNF